MYDVRELTYVLVIDGFPCRKTGHIVDRPIQCPCPGHKMVKVRETMQMALTKTHSVTLVTGTHVFQQALAAQKTVPKRGKMSYDFVGISLCSE